MANTKRRYIDNSGNMFIPMNVEGGSWNEHFMTTPKLVILGLSIFMGVCLIAWLRSKFAGIPAYIIIMGLYLVGFQFMFRYVIFEEKFYYRMYKNLKEYEITTPATFWDIASIKETSEGLIMTYADGKIGILVKLERDTITGKNAEFKEEHYDAISDFYKEIMLRKYSFVQMNIMEQAGNDPRLAELDKLTLKNKNENICKLMEMQIGHIKNITHRTLYESDYVLVYTKDLTRIDSIINDTIECVYKIMDGAFIGYRIITARDIIELIKEEYGVKYFNYTEATLAIFKRYDMLAKKPFELSAIEYSDGKVQKVGNRELNIINNMASKVLNGTLDINSISFKDALFKDNSNNEVGIDFDSLTKGFENTPNNQKSTENKVKRFTKTKKSDNPKMGNLGNSKVEENDSVSEFNTFEEHSNCAFDDIFDSNIGTNQQKITNIKGDFSISGDTDEKIDF